MAEYFDESQTRYETCKEQSIYLEEEYKYSSNPSLTSALDGGGWLTTSMTAETHGSFTGWNWAKRASPPRVSSRGDGVRINVTHLLLFHSKSSTGSRLSSVKLHSLFLNSLSWLGMDRCRRLNFALKAGSPEIYHCLLDRFISYVPR